MKNKILFVRTVPYEFNANTYNVQGFGLGKAFCKLGFDFDFLYFSKNEPREYVLIEENGHRVKVISKPRIRLLRTGICKEICNREFLQQYDFVISCEYDEYMTYALSKASDNVVMYSGPYYNLFYLPFISPIYDMLFTKSINKNVKYKFVKSVLAKEFMEKKGYDNIHTIGVALDIERFNSKIEIKPETQKLINYMQDNKCILYVGALSDRKNYPFLLKIYERLVKERPDIKFVIIGKGKKSYVKKYMNRISNEARKGIYRLNEIDNAQLKYIYPLAKAFLLPSKLEIFGMVLLEAMYLGAPVVTSRNGGSTTLIEGKDTGLIVKEFDEKKWVEAIEKYLDNEEYRNITTSKAKKLIAEEYNWDIVARKMLSVIL